MSNDLRFRALLEDHVSSALDKIKDKANQLGGQGTAQSLFGNVGANAAAFGFGIVEGAAQSVVGALSNVIDEGIKGQQSTDRLTASLKANVPAWNGNADAINAAVEANQNLGFADDETKDSLGRLVVATHSVTKAIQVQQVAMDLARFKGISLGDATDALTKIEAGRFKGLASLGIQLQKGATQQDALNAVEKVAQGQAEAFANTTGGKLVVAQTKWNDAIQKAGETLLPLVADGLNLVTNAVDFATGHLDAATRAASDAATEQRRVLAPAYAETAATINDGFDSTAMHADQWRDEMGDAVDATVAAFSNAEHTIVTTVGALPGDIASEIKKNRDKIASAGNQIAQDLLHPLSLAAEKAQLQGALVGKQMAAGLASKDPAIVAETQQWRHDIQTRLAAIDNIARKSGASISQQLASGMLSKLTKVQQASSAIADAIEARLHVKSPAREGPLSLDGGPGGWGEKLGTMYAEGVQSTVPAVASGVDTGLTGSSGVAMQAPGSGGSGGTVNIAFNSTWPPTPAQARAIAAVISAQLAGDINRASATIGRA